MIRRASSKIAATGLALGLALGLMVAAPTPALATPPDVIDIREEPFGLSETHLFVIRTSDDNLGLYESLRVESFLVAIELKTGAEEVWLLDRVERRSEYSKDGELLGYKVLRDKGLEPGNPYAIMTQRGALPWAAISFEGERPFSVEVVQDEGGVTATYSDGGVFRVTSASLERRLKDLLASVTQSVADRQRMSTLTTRQIFAERAVPSETCKAGDTLQYWRLGRPVLHRLLRVNCFNEDEGLTSLIVRMEHVPGTGTP